MPLPVIPFAYLLLPLALCAGAAMADAPQAGRQQTFTLDHAVSLALEHNPDMKIANERIAAAEAAIGESLAAFYPQVKARIGYHYTDNPAQAFAFIVAQRRFDFGQDINSSKGVTNFRPEVEATWSLYRGGQDYQRSKVADLSKEISELELAAVRNNLLDSVNQGFYALLIAQENQTIAKRAIAALQGELDETQKRYAAGTVLKSDLLSLNARIAAARALDIRARNAGEKARTVLRTLLDLDDADPLEPDIDAERPLPALPPAFDALRAEALANRPETHIAHRQLETRRLELNIAQGEHLPRVDAYVNFGLNERSPAFSNAHQNVGSGIQVEMDLFSGFATSARASKAEHRLAEAEAQIRKTELQIAQDVKTAYLELQEALQRAEVARSAVASADEALRLVTLQHRAGAATITRFIESEAARDQAQAEWLSARYDALRAEASLQRSMGSWH